MKKIILLFTILFAAGLINSRAQNTWTKKANFGGTARYGAVGFYIGSKGYIGTGYDGNYTKDFWEFDPATNAWTQKADFGGAARYFATGFSIGSKGYIGTGTFNFITSLNDLWEYDPATNAWAQKADFGGTTRWGAVGFSVGNKGYIGTGTNDGVTSYYNDFWEYDPATNGWTQKANFEGGTRGYAVGFSIGSKGYLGTGTNNNQSSYFNDFWEYNPSTNAWTKKANFGGTKRLGATGFSIGSKGYIGTGHIDVPFINYNDFWEYDSATDTWTQKAYFGGTGRWHSVGFSIESKGYVGTGYDGSPKKDFWEYTPENTCLAPSGLNVQKISDTSAMLKWDVAGADILRVKVLFRVVGNTAWAIRTNDAAKTKRHIHSLIPNTTYEWQLRSFCAEDTSRWVKGPNFTTAASFAFSSTTPAITSSKLPGNIYVQIMPNPNKGNFTIQLQLPAKAALTTLALYNNMGEKIWQQDAGKISGAVRKNISLQNQLPAGIYMMIIQRNDVRLEQKVVISK